MPSIKVNSGKTSRQSYQEAQVKWMKELKQARRAARLAESTSASASSTNISSSGDQPLTTNSPTVLPMAAATSTVSLVGSGQPQASSSSSSTSSVHVAGAPAASAPLSLPAVTLSDEQQRVFQRVKAGQNVFFTGPAGTGKSVLLREIISWARQRYQTDEIAITASTGIAGLNIGGSTIHSFAGIGLGKESADDLASRILKSTRSKERWRSCRLLLIDEISMLDGLLFDKLETIARIVRKSQASFGGIQLVLSGDFFQLPPVPDQSHNYWQASTFAFQGKAWGRCISQPMFLQRVFRQTDDTFIELLASIRQGKVEPKHIDILRSLQRTIHYDDGIGPTRLYPLKAEVEGFNNEEIAKLPGHEFRYESVDSGGFDPYNEPVPEPSVRQLLDRMIAVSSLTLKVGAQVMLISNVVQGRLVNGSVGKVLEFLTIRDALDRNIAIAELNDQHHSGKPLEERARTKEEQLTEITQKLVDEPSRLRPLSNSSFNHRQYWPLVRFTDGSELLCPPLAFTAQGFRGNIEAHRLQVPLILSWAMTCHKSQGQTLDRVKVNLKTVFENGQAYVALSRARSLEGLEIENFDPSKIRADPRVVTWQAFFSAIGLDDAMMDSEEAIQGFWDDSPY